MDSIVTPEHRVAARKLRALVAIYEAKRDLVMLGAYAKGTDKELDDAIARMPAIEAFLQQDPRERAPIESTVTHLVAGLR
jgi:flagellar biosynthesis/type III secretory pathway ATPase